MVKLLEPVPKEYVYISQFIFWLNLKVEIKLAAGLIRVTDGINKGPNSPFPKGCLSHAIQFEKNAAKRHISNVKLIITFKQLHVVIVK